MWINVLIFFLSVQKMKLEFTSQILVLNDHINGQQSPSMSESVTLVNDITLVVNRYDYSLIAFKL